MAIYEYFCSKCDKHVEEVHRMGDFSSPLCCGGDMIKIMSLPQPAIFVVTNRNMLVNSLNDDDKSYEFPGEEKHGKRYKSAVKKSLTELQNKPVIGKGF